MPRETVQPVSLTIKGNGGDRDYPELTTISAKVDANYHPGNGTAAKNAKSPDICCQKKGSTVSASKKYVDLLCVGMAEFTGTALLVFLGCAACVTGENTAELISLTFGIAVMISIQTFGHISGAHLNPAVTVSAVIFGLTKLRDAPAYVIGQMLGALFGMGLLKSGTPSNFFINTKFNPKTNMTETSPGVCTTVPSSDVSAFQAFVMETTLTAALIFVCCGVWDKRNATKSDSVPIRFGLAVAGLAMAGGRYSGASMNPARSFAPALINGYWDNNWIYWVGPLLAAVGTTYAYIYVWRTKEEAPIEDQYEDVPLSEREKPTNSA